MLNYTVFGWSFFDLPDDSLLPHTAEAYSFHTTTVCLFKP